MHTLRDNPALYVPDFFICCNDLHFSLAFGGNIRQSFQIGQPAGSKASKGHLAVLLNQEEGEKIN